MTPSTSDVAVPTENERARKSLVGTTGSGWRRERVTSNAPATAVPTNADTVAAEPHPQLLPSEIASTMRAIEAVARTVPIPSRLAALRPGARRGRCFRTDPLTTPGGTAVPAA